MWAAGSRSCPRWDSSAGEGVPFRPGAELGLSGFANVTYRHLRARPVGLAALDMGRAFWDYGGPTDSAERRTGGEQPASGCHRGRASSVSGCPLPGDPDAWRTSNRDTATRIAGARIVTSAGREPPSAIPSLCAQARSSEVRGDTSLGGGPLDPTILYAFGAILSPALSSRKIAQDLDRRLPCPRRKLSIGLG